MLLTEQQIQAYQREGFLSGIRVVEEAEAARYRALFDELEAREGREKAQIGLLDRHFDQPFIWELATRPEVLDCVESLIGPNILLLATHFFCKYGQDAKFVAWHQDVTYWGLEPPSALTVWYAVDDSDCENGCMRVLPGTHCGGVREHGKAQAQGNLLSINQEVPVTPEEENRATDLILRAGEVSIHDGALIHGSLPNRSHRRRCGLTLRYVPTSVRPVALNSMGKTWHAVLVRGEDREKHFGERAQPFPLSGAR
ncbi:MAG TPA: phytanoyl-CoA dioxygenase family protein [Chthonomonadaceae bacterium]|nr:phytanoyl-CoA dioxygenase family protein [Chthonomonadaceae bacterium]